MRGAHIDPFKTNGQIGHTCAEPQKLRWPRSPRCLIPSLPTSYRRLHHSSATFDAYWQNK